MKKTVDLTMIAFISLSLLSGYLFLMFLVSSPLQSPFYSAGFSLVLMGIVVLGYRSFKNWLRLVAAPLFLLSFITGYLIGTAIFLRPITRKELPPLEIPASKQSDGFTAVIYFNHGEPPTYDKAIPAWKHSIQEMDESGAPFIPYPFRSFFFNAVRTEFLKAGGSHHNAIHNRMMMKLEQMMRSNYPNLRFYISFIDDRPHPNEAAWQAVKAGANKNVRLILVFSSSISAEGIHSAYEIPEMLNEVSVPEGVRLVNLGAWNDHPLVLQAIAERIESCLDKHNQ